MEAYLCQPNLTMERLPGEGEKERRERGDKENGGYAGSIGWGGREGNSGI